MSRSLGQRSSRSHGQDGPGPREESLEEEHTLLGVTVLHTLAVSDIVRPYMACGESVRSYTASADAVLPYTAVGDGQLSCTRVLVSGAQYTENSPGTIGFASEVLHSPA
ncbi:hypothetical protein K466DRAFT_348617 [Polyporus arcularius HHB13444]|uniref:Uncharacterized protein n=1 Tax=Polyporus arcularius HHB13444 TaxID=1314778 RepID=A0A5C3NUZ8_9APHY|nr:hypothetical protein K466DRAFT_348617 [Polyporus arcularius HHB13444]